MILTLQSTLTCPDCGTQAVETMPTDACLYFYTCNECGTRLKPKRGDCCVFCSYGSVPCPPIQVGAASECCVGAPEARSPAYCSLEPRAFEERMGTIAALMQRYEGHARRTPRGLELRFKAREGLRAALEDLAEKERACCVSLSFSVIEEAESTALRIAAQADDHVAIDDLATRLAAARGR